MTDILKDTGLDRFPAFFRDPLLHAALIAAVMVWAVLWFTALPTFSLRGESIFSIALIGLVWSPIAEEIIFRGVLQGALFRRHWGRQRFLYFSTANWTASALFVLAHLLHQPAIWALMVLAPSLVYGFFRDRYDNTFPCIFLHAYFNGGFILINVMAQ